MNKKAKYFPMPDYDLTEYNSVKAILYGKIIDEKVDYMENKGLDNTFYKALIIDYLKQFKQATRKDINQFIYSKLPSTLTKDEKSKRVTYLLTSLRKENKIVNTGSDTKSIWILKNN